VAIPLPLFEWMCYTPFMKKSAATPRQVQEPFVKRMATIVFDANIVCGRNTKPVISPVNLCLSDKDLGVFNSLSDSFFRDGVPIVSKSAKDIASIMPMAVFMDALPRLAKARAISVTFWEHFASAPKLWRKVKTF